MESERGPKRCFVHFSLSAALPGCGRTLLQVPGSCNRSVCHCPRDKKESCNRSVCYCPRNKKIETSVTLIHHEKKNMSRVSIATVIGNQGGDLPATRH